MDPITFKSRLSKAGTVTVKIERLVRRKLRAVDILKRCAKAGAGSLTPKGKRLGAGSYRATITATRGATTPSAARTVRFTIARAK